MDFLFHDDLHPYAAVLLCAAIGMALAFEAVNGFHDAANAVATVIYTNSMGPRAAVIMSGLFNFLGVYLGGTAVAFAVVHLLPVDLLVDVGAHKGLAMIMALLIAAILWNFGTWYKGIPASSSHTLIGAVIGVGLANGFIEGKDIASSVSIGQVQEVLLSLLISPVLGFALAALFLLLVKLGFRERGLFESPEGRKPPLGIRCLMLLTSAAVSIAHGSNDGQKGVGLIMLILIGALPTHFALNSDYRPRDHGEAVSSLASLERVITSKRDTIQQMASAKSAIGSDPSLMLRLRILDPLLQELREIREFLENVETMASVDPKERWRIRNYILLLEGHIKDVENSNILVLSGAEKQVIAKTRSELREMTDYAPGWVMLMVACAIGLGTMVGWKRVVTTIGERIGRNPMTYAQGASAQVVASVTIGMADVLGMPVSTTHVLSSGVAGSMVASKVGLEYATLRDIALAWVLTFPLAMILAGILFLAFKALV